FSDQSHFTKTFGKIMGLTPRQFRKRQRDSAERAAAAQPARSR
ncbi:MAG: AraC family transcriptional regulator, partial [Planctomycetes bacterium]|nr:AraC family transcriptional regulator [Planctomycetota bacterium]